MAMAGEFVTESTERADCEDRDAMPLRRVREAIGDDLHVLAALHDRELGQELLSCLRQSHFPATMALANGSDRSQEAAALFAEAIAGIGEAPPARLLDELSADYAAIYLNHAYQVSPCESVWLDPEGLALQDATFRIRAWYRRFGLTVKNWRTRSDDHLVAQLHFIGTLFHRPGDVELAEIARFMDEHLLRWLSMFAAKVAQRCETQFYAGAALLTSAYCEDIRDLLADVVGEPRPSPEEIEKRMKPGRETEAVPIVFHPGSGPSW
jgi:TorA maturation chaperone TorD